MSKSLDECILNAKIDYDDSRATVTEKLRLAFLAGAEFGFNVSALGLTEAEAFDMAIQVLHGVTGAYLPTRSKTI